MRSFHSQMRVILTHLQLGKPFYLDEFLPCASNGRGMKTQMLIAAVFVSAVRRLGLGAPDTQLRSLVLCLPSDLCLSSVSCPPCFSQREQCTVMLGDSCLGVWGIQVGLSA